jgi:hypothetical protein
MPITHVLAVPDTPGSEDNWQTKYVKAFKKEWQVHLPDELLGVLTGTELLGRPAVQQPHQRDMRLQLAVKHMLATSTLPLTGSGPADVSTYNHAVRLALLLLWVQRHVAAPFWQQWVQQLPRVEEYTASGTAWGPGDIKELQWPVLQVGFHAMQHASKQPTIGGPDCDM